MLRAMKVLGSVLRLAIGFVFVGVVIGIIVLGCAVLLPFGRKARVIYTNQMAVLLGSGVLRIAGSKVTVHGRENIPDAPVIFANNHTSNLDAFLTVWLTPLGTVGLAKKEIVYYPFFGQGWWLSGQALVDRSNQKRAHASMQALGAFLKDKNLKICMLPEGTRSRDGRLLPFKKGIVHLAVQTGLPIVPMVTTGAFGAWNKGQWMLEPRDIHVTFLPPVDTSGWSLDHLEVHLDEVRRRFVEALPTEMLSPEDRALSAAA
ncbi:MAG: lysophospholipid acyltransferase family protein [Myxococcota bacterium]